MYQLERIELRELLEPTLYGAVLHNPSHHAMNPSVATYFLQTLHRSPYCLAIPERRDRSSFQ